MILFSSFSSENNSEFLPKKVVFETKIVPKKKEFLIQEKKQKSSFKEKIALKLLTKKKFENSKKPIGDIIFISTFILLYSAGIILGIIYLTLGKTLLGLFLLLGGFFVIPAIFMILFMGFFMGDKTRKKITV